MAYSVYNDISTQFVIETYDKYDFSKLGNADLLKFCEVLFIKYNYLKKYIIKKNDYEELKDNFLFLTLCPYCAKQMTKDEFYNYHCCSSCFSKY